MTRVFSAPLLLLALGACAADGTTVATAPVSASASAVAAPGPRVPVTTGTVAAVEQVTPMSRQGGNAAVAIGASIMGAFIPGPWGGVASVATGQAGQVAMNTYSTKAVRYTIRMSDGTVEQITQNDALAMPIGTPVEFVTLSSGSRRLVQSGTP